MSDGRTFCDKCYDFAFLLRFLLTLTACFALIIRKDVMLFEEREIIKWQKL